jgi:hypothetical protein
VQESKEEETNSPVFDTPGVKVDPSTGNKHAMVFGTLNVHLHAGLDMVERLSG